jgi:hypothetical protein
MHLLINPGCAIQCGAHPSCAHEALRLAKLANVTVVGWTMSNDELSQLQMYARIINPKADGRREMMGLPVMVV